MLVSVSADIFPQTLDKILAICNISDDSAFFDRSQDYMMQDPWGIQSGSTWHSLCPL